MLVKKMMQPSIYSVLYNKIPKDHLLVRISECVDFGFVNEVLKDSYSKNMGRPAKEPEMMMKLLLLQRLCNLSDERVIEEAGLNLVYMWFLGINPEDDLPDSSLLAKFRTQRLGDGELEAMITECVRQCAEKGLIDTKALSVSIDTTHTHANTKRLTPERMMKRLSEKVLLALRKDNEGKLPAGVDDKIPDYASIEDHAKAKQVMLEYLLSLVSQASEASGRHTEEVLAEVREVLEDEKFIVQKGQRSLVDKDARVGAKSKTDRFFGYKSELMMDTDSRIITAVGVHSGEYADGTNFDELLDTTLSAGVRVSEAYGDKAYFRKGIIDRLDSIEATGYIPVSASTYRVDEEMFSYNKDSDQWFCAMGAATVKVRRKTRRRGDIQTDNLVYTFDAKTCTACTKRAQCMGKDKKRARKLEVSARTPRLYEESQRQKSPEFIAKYKKRASIEWKNAELKRLHGMDRAYGFSLRSVKVQVCLTVLAVNLKRIATLTGEKRAKYSLKAPCQASVAYTTSALSFFSRRIMRTLFLAALFFREPHTMRSIALSRA
jgi:transposase